MKTIKLVPTAAGVRQLLTATLVPAALAPDIDCVLVENDERANCVIDPRRLGPLGAGAQRLVRPAGVVRVLARKSVPYAAVNAGALMPQRKQHHA